MNPYQYLNTNNNQTADLSHNANAKALIDSLLSGANVTTKDDYAKAYQRDENGNLTQNLLFNENGQQLYNSGEDTPDTNAGTRTFLNGYDVTPIGDNSYQIGIDDPSTKGMFTLNAQIDPLTNKLSNLGTIYKSNKSFDYKTPAMFAALVGGGLLAAPYLGGASLFGEGALAGGGLAEGGAVASGESAVGGGASLGNGTAYAEGALTNPLSPYYGTAATSPTGLTLASGGGGATIGEGSIIGSGAGLGQTVPASAFGASSAFNIPKNLNLPKSSKQQQMANALRLPTNANTSMQVYNHQNPFLTSTQQNLANMLKV